MQQILNMILRRLFNKGVNHGFKAAGNRANRNSDGTTKPRQMNRSGKNHAKNFRVATRLLRKFTKL